MKLLRYCLLFTTVFIFPLPWPGEEANSRAQAEVLAGAGPHTVDSCPVPEDLLTDNETLPGVADRLKTSEPLVIVAIGGASTRGVGALDKAYPARLQAHLHSYFPSVPITVVNQGHPKETAEQIKQRFEKEVVSLHPSLVIWETGTNDAVHQVPTDRFGSIITDGISLLHSNKIEVVLMDMQFSWETASIINYQPYIDTIRSVAETNGVRVFRRYDIMRYWSDAGRYDFGGTPEQLSRLTEEVYDCVARRVVDMLVLATR